jgi:hypothetical protein
MAIGSPGNLTILGNPAALNWTSAIGTFSSSNITSSTSFKNNNGNSVLEIGESVKVNGKLEINGEDIGERLARIEDMLHIPRRDVIMEQKYEKLKTLWQEYNETLEAIKTWETIKESS